MGLIARLANCFRHRNLFRRGQRLEKVLRQVQLSKVDVQQVAKEQIVPILAQIIVDKDKGPELPASPPVFVLENNESDEELEDDFEYDFEDDFDYEEVHKDYSEGDFELEEDPEDTGEASAAFQSAVKQHLEKLGLQDIVQIGKGSFGAAYSFRPGAVNAQARLFTDVPLEQDEVAVIKVTCLPSPNTFEHEVTMYQRLGPHPNIVAYKGAFKFWLPDDTNPDQEPELTLSLVQPESKPGFNPYFGGLVLEKFTTDLLRWERPDGGVSEAVGERLLRDVGGALVYCQSLGMMHNDLAERNIAVYTGKDPPTFKLFDFGEAELKFYGREEAEAQALRVCPRGSAHNLAIPWLLSCEELDYNLQGLFAETMELARIVSSLIWPVKNLRTVPEKPSDSRLRQLLRRMWASDQNHAITIKRSLELLDE